MRWVRGFFRFWYDFIIGDDWRTAAGVAIVFVVGAIAVAAGAGDYLPPLLAAALVVVFAVPILTGPRTG